MKKICLMALLITLKNKVINVQQKGRDVLYVPAFFIY